MRSIINTLSVCIMVALALLCTCEANSRGADVQADENLSKMLAYYTQQSVITDPGEYAHMYADLPSDIPALCSVTQNALLHIFWIPAYGVELSEERKKEVNIRTVAGMLARIGELNDQPVTVTRTPETRLVGNCRDFTVFLCSMLRHKGIPARARCGFSRYFTPGRYDDHWICEYWNTDEKRWVQVDAQLDSIQIKTLNIDFNPYDVPADKFLNAGKVWQGCRAGDIDPELCGIFQMKGLWFVQGDLVRDCMALNKLEVLPWDSNEIMPGPDQPVSEADYTLLDNVAKLVTAGNESFVELRALYDSTAVLHMPADWKP